MRRLSRSLSRFETQDIKTQPMNQPIYLPPFPKGEGRGGRWLNPWRVSRLFNVEEFLSFRLLRPSQAPVGRGDPLGRGKKRIEKEGSRIYIIILQY